MFLVNLKHLMKLFMPLMEPCIPNLIESEWSQGLNGNPIKFLRKNSRGIGGVCGVPPTPPANSSGSGPGGAVLGLAAGLQGAMLTENMEPMKPTMELTMMPTMKPT